MKVHKWHVISLEKCRRETSGVFYRKFEWETSSYKIPGRMVSNIDQLLGCYSSLIDGKVTTNLYVKPTDSHHYFHSSSCHPYHCKKGIPYSQALPLNRFFSDPISFDRRCDDLEKW